MISKVYKIVSCLSTGTLLVTLLYWLSGTPNTYKNGFYRKIDPDYLSSWHSMDLDGSTFRIVGSTCNQAFLSDVNDPLKVKTIDFDLSVLQTCHWSSTFP